MQEIAAQAEGLFAMTDRMFTMIQKEAFNDRRVNHNLLMFQALVRNEGEA